ncbi:PblB [Streptococcus pneumoniae]|nr:PblB [Streptococcus pneumoniae]
MDALTRRQFDRAMFAKERTLAIRVGEYASRDIKEASFEYGYIKGDTYKPGGTCAGSGKITFTSIITTFNKLDTLHPEIGLLVGDTYQWVKMGEYFINDIEIDRNRNTTTLELMDGMFKLNREYVTDLHFPAEVREVIQEICLKTGIELANDYFGISAMRYHIEQVPEGKKLSFRDMLSAMTQMIGMSCFFNREGKMEIRDLTESNITINADSYFLHGLTKSEIEYQIAGITCKTDKKSLTVGMKTGRSLELDNVFMTQSALNDLYYKLKNLTYYPYNLNYQGHLLLEVGQWVTIQTNKKETFKVPVLSQSFTFKGGLRGRISADSKAGNDTQYSYEGTITKHIKQQDDIEAKIQAQIEAADKDFDQKVDKIKKDFNDQVELAKARAEEVKRELSDTINQRFNSFDNGPLKETKRKAEEALRNAGASTLLAQEAKRIGLDSVARLEAFKSQTTSAQTALSGDLDALKRTIANDIRPKQAQAEAEIAKQAEALVQTKKELAGASTLLAQEAKRIELDSVARLEAFKSQTTSAQTALSGDLDVLKRTIANDIRPKQAQAEAEIAKQVEALSRTKNELAGVKSAQATYKETTTRRLSELTNLANGKASKSELTQTAEELSSKIASVQVGGINLLRNTASLLIGDRSKGCWMSSSGGNGRAISVEVLAPPQKMIKNMIRVIENTNGGNKDLTQLVRLRIGEKYTISCYARVASDSPNANVNLLFRSWANDTDLNRKFQKSISHKNWQKYSFTFTADAIENSIQFGQSGAGIIEICAPKIESGTLATDYSEAPEDIEGQISTVESTFKQRADSLDAGVRSLTEGLRTKADISSLNVTAENIRQSVKSLETDTQNKLNQKLSQAEFEVRAGSIRQEILNATKDKASKSELTQTAEELASRIASVQASGRNLFLNSLFKQDIPKTGIWTTSTYTAAIDSESKYLGHKALKIIGLNPSGRDGGNPKVTYPALGQFGKVIPGSTTNQDVTISFYAKANKNGIMLRSRLGNIGYKTGNVTLSTEIKRYVVHIPKGWTNESKQTTNEWLFNFNQEGTVWIWMPKFEISDVDTSYSEAPEDIEGQISTVESTFKQRANSLDAGVRSLTEGLRTKADISSLNVTAENIRQSVKSLETDTQNKLNQKLSQAEFEVRAGSIRQEILNATKDKASKSELTQTAEELASRIASVQASGRNLFLNSLFKQDIPKTGIWTTSTYTAAIDSESKYLGHKALKIIGLNPSGRDGGNPKVTYPALGQFGKVIPGSTTNQDVTISFYAKANKNGIMLRSRLGNIGYKTGNVTLSTEIKRYVVHIPKGWTNESKQTTNEWLFNFNQEGTVWIWMPKFEISDVDTSYSEAPEDIEGQISTVESTFKQRANSLEAGVNRLTEGLRTKVDISALNVTAENIRQSVKSLETDTQNKLNQKLSQAEFEVRAGSIRQEILNATKDKASKSELTQTAEELASRIASVKVGGRNYYRDSEKIRTSTRFFSFPLHPYLSQENVGETWTLSFDLKINEGGEIRPLLFYHYQTNRFGLKASADITPSKEWQRFTFTGPVIFPNDDPRYSRGEMALYDHGGNNNYSVRRIKLEKGTLATDWSPAIEDIEGQISTVESTFKQRANSLDAGVSRLTEGLRTKVDISSLNVTAENIRQSVKSLETDTQNKLNQKLSQAEFEVRASGIRQEILNATKDKADKTLVTAEAGKLREELTSLSVGENLFVNSDFKNLRDNGQRYTANGKTYQNMIAPYWYNPYNAGIPNAQNIQHGYFDTETFSDTVFAFNESDGSRHWKALSTDFKIGVISAGEYYFSADLYATDLGTHIKFGFYYHNSTGKLNFYAGRTKIEVTEKGRWTRLGIDLKVNDDIDLTKKVQFYIYGYNFASNSILYLKKPKVSKGRLKSDWSPALEDTEGLITEAKATFERTAQGLRTDLSAIQEYVNKDGQRQEALQRYTREESTRQATAVRELVNRDFVGKATYQEDVKGINQRIEAVKTSANKDIASQIASYRQSVDGKFTDISSQITTYKQDVGGQISGLSNRLTSSEQGTTTQISNLSNRINSNKQGTDNQISNLKTQVATNKDNAERQMGRISDQVSANKANADSQFANVTNQLARKVETTDFQRVKETSKLYERILGNTENGIADKVARMALTNQLFQVEVGKVAKGGRNYIRNGQFKNGSKNWLEYQSVNFGLNFNYQHSQNPNNRNRPGLHFYHDSQDVANFFGIQQSFAFDGVRGEKVSVSLLVSKDGGDSNSGLKVALHYIKNKNIIGQEWQNIPSPQITSKYKRFTFTFTLSDDVENLNLMLFGEKGKTINLYVTDVQLERGSVATDYKEAPEDTDEAIRSVQSQLTGSWAVQNINSAGAIISGINLGANGHNRFVGKLTHITGETLIDRAVIKSAMVDKLKTANFEAGSVTTTILDAEAVTAEKLKVDNALIRKLTANDAFIDQLISKRIFSTKVESVISSSTFLEAYQGRIGGFTLGQFDQGGGRWISGVNQFSVGMGNGAGYGVRTAFWANWGNNWNYAGPKAWNVNTDGKMYCRNEVGFYDQVDFSNSSRANFYGNTTFSRSPVFSNGIELGSKDVLGDGWNPKGGRNAVVWWNQVGSGSVKYWMEQKSDRRLKENITDTAVKALDKINRLRMVAFDFIENKKHEEIGLIAQEAETIVPRIVSRDPENPDGYLHIDYTALVPYLIKAIQELNQKIEKMEKTIA